MYIKCWGARGSSPVSGQEFLKYGGNTTCIEVRAGKPRQTILIDFGTGALPMGREFVRQGNKNLDVLLTHTHWDHIMGFPLFPLLFVPGSRIKFHFNPTFQGNPEKLVVLNMMKSPHFPVNPQRLPARFSYQQTGSDFKIGSVKITSIPLSHPNLGLGYRLEYAGKNFVFLTDNELGHAHPGGKSLDEYIRFCDGADLLIHDAEYFDQHEYKQTKGFGHSTVDQAMELAAKAGVKSLGLFHHNRERTDNEIDQLIHQLNQTAPEKYTFNIFAVYQGLEINL
ncbi:MAG: MBL fold metallo-hydrolase [Desulfonatronovibrio sp.]